MKARIAVLALALLLGGCLRTRFDRCAEAVVDCRFLDSGLGGDGGPDAGPTDAPPTDAPLTDAPAPADGGTDAP